MTRTTACLLALLLLLSPQESFAYHTETERQTDFSAWSLSQGELRLGLFQQEVGIFDWWTVGTYTVPWLLIPVSRSFNGSLYTKFKFLDTGRFAASFQPKAFYLSFYDLQVQGLEDGDFQALIMPLELTTSLVINHHFSASLEATWVQTLVNADAKTVDEHTALGAIAQNNLQFALYGEYRLSRVVAFNLTTRLVPYSSPVNLNGEAEATDATTVNLNADLQPDGPPVAWLVQPGAAFSWRTFNFHIGVGYGNVILPGVRIVSQRKFIVPDFDVFWRF